jgi:hypothetical protein
MTPRLKEGTALLDSITDHELVRLENIRGRLADGLQRVRRFGRERVVPATDGAGGIAGRNVMYRTARQEARDILAGRHTIPESWAGCHATSEVTP